MNMLRRRSSFFSLFGILISSFAVGLGTCWAGSISGKVTFDGVAVGTAGVYAQAFTSADVWGNNGVVASSTGEYTINDLEDGTGYKVRFWAHGTDFVTRWYSDVNENGVDYNEATLITVNGGGQDTLGKDINLLSGGSISGTVTYHETGAQVVGALIDAYDSSGVWRGSAVTSDTGFYKVTGLPAGSHKLQIFESSYESSLKEWYLDASSFTAATEVTVTSGADNSGKDVVLGGAGTVSSTAHLIPVYMMLNLL